MMGPRTPVPGSAFRRVSALAMAGSGKEQSSYLPRASLYTSRYSPSVEMRTPCWPSKPAGCPTFGNFDCTTAPSGSGIAGVRPNHGGNLRIEMRALPAGPTIVDMLANAAFLIGGVLALAPLVPDLLPAFPFALAERNFYRAAQYGLDAEFAWPSGKCSAPCGIPARKLLQMLIPLAAQGLAEAGVAAIDLFLGTFEQRVRSGTTGAVWQRAVYDALIDRGLQQEWALSEMLRALHAQRRVWFACVRVAARS